MVEPISRKKRQLTSIKNPLDSTHRKYRGVVRLYDKELQWLERDFPQLSQWQTLAVKWLKGETVGIEKRVRALVLFFDKYLAQGGLPVEPKSILLRSTVLPDFYQTTCPHSVEGVKLNNNITNFLNFVLLHECSFLGDDGRPIISSLYHNPVNRQSQVSLPRLHESVHSPLPYGYIDRLRTMLAAGPNFEDWKWAQSALGVAPGQRGQLATDWYQVTEAMLDREDPDCVWRLRSRSETSGGPVLEMWSPVRWVALLIKLILPLRTYQVRLLDSGEADTWRYQAGNWVLNEHAFVEGSELRPLQQGVFRRISPSANNEAVSTVIYVNTNKTNDIGKTGPDRGYALPWPAEGHLHESVFYWLEKMRNWQEKYNPIQRRTSWMDLDGRHIGVKSEVQLAGYPDACFLFRLPESQPGARHFPLNETHLFYPWFKLLEALEVQMAANNETHRNGSPIRFLPALEVRKHGPTTLFPLHSLRVSLITALALEGQVPFPVLQKLVGHSRLMMTLYYTKPGNTRIRNALANAAERLDASKESSIQNFLLDTQYEQLLRQAICTNTSGVAAAIPQHPAARNPAGWMPMHHGLCLVGGNSSDVEGSSTLGGCHNGGASIGTPLKPKHAPVPGGSRNCVRCRWFVTEPHYLPALTAHFNTISYHFDEARNTCLSNETLLQDLKKQKIDTEDAGLPFTRYDEYRQAERVWETAMNRFSDLAEDLVACFRFIERCQKAHETSSCHGDGMQLVAGGTVLDVHLAFEETESELLQLAGVCQNAEVYPDLEPGKAIFRRSQLLDRILYQDKLAPVFMLLSEQDQLRFGNAFMSRLAQQMNPDNPAIGQRQVIGLIDAGVSLSDYFNIDLAALVPDTIPIKPLSPLSVQ